MEDNALRTGQRVVTRRGGTHAVIHSISRHPITRKVTAVVLNPGNVTEADFVTTTPRNLKLVAA